MCMLWKRSWFPRACAMYCAAIWLYPRAWITVPLRALHGLSHARELHSEFDPSCLVGCFRSSNDLINLKSVDAANSEIEDVGGLEVVTQSSVKFRRWWWLMEIVYRMRRCFLRLWGELWTLCTSTQLVILWGSDLLARIVTGTIDYSIKQLQLIILMI